MLRKAVLNQYKRLMRAQGEVFRDDVKINKKAMEHIREQFRKNRNLKNESEIRNMINMAEDSIQFMKKHLVQGVLNDRNVYELRFRKDTDSIFRPLPHHKCCNDD